MTDAEIDRAIQDVTQEPSDLEKLRHISDQLLEPELAVHIVENAHSAIIIARKDETIFYVNRGAELLFRYARGELYDKSVTCLIPTRLMVQHVEAFNRWLEKPYLRSFEQPLHTLGLTKDGEEIPIKIALLPVVIAAGFFIVATIRKKSDNEPTQ